MPAHKTGKAMELVPHPNGAIPASQGDISGKSDAGHLDFGLVRRRGLRMVRKGREIARYTPQNRFSSGSG
jgi:hypothetical protein